VPITPTFPGVYVEEIASGVRTITGVATSVTAFIGRTSRGQVNKPTTIFNYGSFERLFGGLAADYPLSYAVRDFFLNGGGQAIIVRLYTWAPPPDQPAGAGANDPVITEATKAAKALFDASRTEATKDGATVASVLAMVRETAIKLTLDPILAVATARKALSDAEGTLAPKAQAATKALTDLRAAEALAQSIMQRLTETTDVALAGNLKNDVSTALGTVTQKTTALDKSALDQSKELGLAQTQRVALITAMRTVAALQSIADGAKGAISVNVRAGADGKLDTSKLPAANDAIAKFVKDTLGSAQAAPAASEPDPASESGPLDYAAYKRGFDALRRVDLFNLLCVPPDARAEQADGYALRTSVYQDALNFCAARRAMLIVDPPPLWSDVDTLISNPQSGLDALNLAGEMARNAAIFYPRVQQPDPLNNGKPDYFAPCGIVAGVMARTDATRGVWKAPAGIDAAMNGIVGLEVSLTDDENGTLNQLGVNCLRAFPVYGRVVWGARTLRGADQIADEYKYIPVRRTALFIEESLFRGLKWVVFEPNDEPLWAQIRLNVGAFMHNLFRQGAFQGTTPRDAYFVKCDKETTTQNDINLGIVNIVVGFAPLKPAEFVFIKLQQITGQIEV